MSRRFTGRKLTVREISNRTANQRTINVERNTQFLTGYKAKGSPCELQVQAMQTMRKVAVEVREETGRLISFLM